MLVGLRPLPASNALDFRCSPGGRYISLYRECRDTPRDNTPAHATRSEREEEDASA